MTIISSSIKTYFNLQHFSGHYRISRLVTMYVFNSQLTPSQWEIVLQGFNCVTQRTALDQQRIVAYFTVITIIEFCVLVSQNIDNNSEDVSNFTVTAICML